MRRLLVVLAAIVAPILACGSSPDDSRGGIGRALLQPAPLATLEKAWKWPSGGRAPRDVQQDDRECRALAADQSQPKQILVVYGRCMTDRGWSRKPVRSAAHSAGSR